MSATVQRAPIRRATEADVRAIGIVMLANEDPPPGEPPSPPGTGRAYLGHLVRRGNVALCEVDGEVVGFGATVETERSTHLADLFVLPALHGRGIGGELLSEVFGDAWPRTTFASDDPRALPLYVRAGMRALWPNLYLAGDPGALPELAVGYRVEPASVEAMGALERAWTGVDRGPELPFWATVPDGRPVIVRAPGGRTVATSLSRRRIGAEGRWIDHAVVAPGADPVPALLAAVRDGLADADVGGACVPGPSPLVRVLLAAGFRILDRDTFMASDSALIDPERVIVNTGLL